MLNKGFRPTRTFTLDENNAEFTYDLPKGVALLGLHLRVAGELSIATGEDVIRSESIYRLLPRLGIQTPLGVIYPDNFSARQHAALMRRLVGNPDAIIFTEPADATAQSNTPIEADVFISFSPAWLAGGPADMHHPPVDADQVAQLVGEWDVSKTNSASDAGTGAVVEDDDASGNAVTWDEVPSVEVTPIYAPQLPQPVAIPRVTVSQGDTFDAVDDRYPVRLRTKLDTPLAILRALDNGTEKDLADLIHKVTIGERADFRGLTREYLSFEERRRFPGVDTSKPGELGLLFADGGKLGTQLEPVTDLHSDDIELEVTAPTGDAKVEVILFHAVRMTQRGVTRANLKRPGQG